MKSLAFFIAFPALTALLPSLPAAAKSPTIGIAENNDNAAPQ